MQIRDVAPSFGIAMIVAVAAYVLKYLPISNWVILPLQLIAGLVVFVVVCKITGNEEFVELKNMVLKYLKKK